MAKKYKAKIPFSVSVDGVDSVEYKKGATIAEEHVPKCHSSLIKEIKAETKVKEDTKLSPLQEAELAVEKAKTALSNAKQPKAKENAQKALDEAEEALAKLAE